jgi:hypothetical protein
MTFQITAPASYVPQTAIAFAADEGAALVSATLPDIAFAPPRAIAVVAQGSGNVAFRFEDASTIVIPVAPGLTIVPFAATHILASGTTAAASFHALA